MRAIEAVMRFGVRVIMIIAVFIGTVGLLYTSITIACLLRQTIANEDSKRKIHMYWMEIAGVSRGKL